MWCHSGCDNLCMGITYANPVTNAQFVRRARGLSQDAVAAAAGISREDLSRIERGFRVPSAGVRKRLAAALDLAPEQVTEAP